MVTVQVIAPAAEAILDFVGRVRDGGSAAVPVEERVAVFDNDGTLWIEQPMYVQLAFILDRVKALAPQNPGWKDMQPFRAVLDGDLDEFIEASLKSGLEAGSKRSDAV